MFKVIAMRQYEEKKEMAFLIYILILLCVPIVWWRISTKGDAFFLQWIGLKKPEVKSACSFWLSVIIGVLCMILSLVIHSFFFPNVYFMGYEGVTLVQIMLSMVRNVIFLLVSALIFEIFFRGFIGKRLIEGMGFVRGNAIQAVVYGFHIALFRLDFTVAAIILYLLHSGFGWIAGYITEKQAGGSIIPFSFMLSTVTLITPILVYFLGLF